MPNSDAEQSGLFILRPKGSMTSKAIRYIVRPKGTKTVNAKNEQGDAGVPPSYQSLYSHTAQWNRLVSFHTPNTPLS